MPNAGLCVLDPSRSTWSERLLKVVVLPLLAPAPFGRPCYAPQVCPFLSASQGVRPGSDDRQWSSHLPRQIQFDRKSPDMPGTQQANSRHDFIGHDSRRSLTQGIVEMTNGTGCCPNCRGYNVARDSAGVWLFLFGWLVPPFTRLLFLLNRNAWCRDCGVRFRR